MAKEFAWRGLFLSVLIRWEVDDIKRFPTAKQFASYTGLVPSTRLEI